MKLRVVASFAILLTGCLGNPDSSGEALLETAECEIDGSGTLADGDLVAGSVRGDEVAVAGTWSHTSDTGALIEATPDYVFCRINGVTIGDVGGRATIDGAGDYEFRVQIEDRGQPGPATQVVRASRFYPGCYCDDDRDEDSDEDTDEDSDEDADEDSDEDTDEGGCGPPWSDGHLDVEGTATVAIPASIPVVVGNGGNQWLDLDFTTSDGDDVRCRYRAGASRRHPRTPDDIAAGESYELRGCNCGSGVDYDAGDEVEVTALTVHVRNGSNRFPTREDAETTVEIEFPTGGEPERDHYRMILFDEDGNRVLTREGELASGDFTISAL